MFTFVKLSYKMYMNYRILYKRYLKGAKINEDTNVDMGISTKNSWGNSKSCK